MSNPREAAPSSSRVDLLKRSNISKEEGMEGQNVVREGDGILLKKGKVMKVFKVHKKQKVFLEKRHFSLDPIIGHPYGSSWELKGGGLIRVTEQDVSHDIAGRIDEGGADNRAIIDDQTAQKLDRDDITDLKQQGKSGQEIIDHLVENSSTFNERTVYSKAKYLKKKQKKHIMKFVVLRPSTRLICEHFFLKAPSKHVQIRMDSLAQMLTASNIQSGSKVMVLDHCQGLLVGAAMERLGGKGVIVQFHTEEIPIHNALEAYNFPKTFKDTLRTFKVRDIYDKLIKKPKEVIEAEGEKQTAETSTSATEVAADATEPMVAEAASTPSEGITGEAAVAAEAEEAENGTQATAVQDSSSKMEVDDQTKIEPLLGKDEEDSQAQKRKIRDEIKNERKRQKLESLAITRETLLERNMDTLLIATKCHPVPILMALIDFLNLSRPFAIFSPYKEPLMECYVKLRDRGGVINLNLTETWYRDYQVLPDRTHPMITMSGTGGYILSGLNVAKSD